MSIAYQTALQESIRDPEAFWLAAAHAINWTSAPSRAYDPTDGWYPGASLNTAFNCVDRHVMAGRGSQTALIYDSPVTNTIRYYTYSDLLEEVGRSAAMLAGLGVGLGDRVILYMPMVPETVFAMLACARLGAIHSVVFGGFAPLELAKRIDDASPCVLLTASCGIEGARIVPYKPLVDQALALATHEVDHVVVLQRDQCCAELAIPRDLDWASLRNAASDAVIPDCASVASDHPLYILYTSGTTGTPKGVVREHGGHAVALAWSMANIYGIGQGETFWAASDVGWVVGHSYIVYAPLIVGAATVLFEGKPVGTPDSGVFWRTIERHGVRVFFTAPTAIRAVRREDPDARLLKQIGTGCLRAIFLAGERADPDTIAWLEDQTQLPVIDHWWQTELGWPAIASCVALGDDRRRHGSAGFPVPGYTFAILGEDGEEVVQGASGALAIKLPLPPGAYRCLWPNPNGYEKSFASFPGYYETGDSGHLDSDGFVHVMGRTDDIINVAGHRLSTGQMEQIVARQDGVVECAVIGADDPVKGMVPVAFVVTRTAEASDKCLPTRVIAGVRSELGAVAAMKTVFVVPQLPKTRSGKILRNLLREIASGKTLHIPPTIDNPTIPEEIKKLVDRERTLPTTKKLPDLW